MAQDLVGRRCWMVAEDGGRVDGRIAAVAFDNMAPSSRFVIAVELDVSGGLVVTDPSLVMMSARADGTLRVPS